MSTILYLEMFHISGFILRERAEIVPWNLIFKFYEFFTFVVTNSKLAEGF